MSQRLENTYEITRCSIDGTSGLAIIFAFEDFIDDSKKRFGTENEIQNLRSFFSKINLRVHVFRNLTRPRMKLALQIITNPDKFKNIKNIPEEFWYARLRTEDSVSFVAITSHGDSTHFELSDGEKMREIDLEEYFYEDTCSILKKRPKLFLYNKCRNFPYSKEPAFEIANSIVTDGLSTPYNLDMLSIYTCAEGVNSLRSKSFGSLVLSELPGAYEEYGKEEHICRFFTRFMDRLVTIIRDKMRRIDHPFPEDVTQIISMERDTMGQHLYFLSPTPKFPSTSLIYNPPEQLHTSTARASKASSINPCHTFGSSKTSTSDTNNAIAAPAFYANGSPSNTSTASPSNASTASPSNTSTGSPSNASTASQYDTSTATPSNASTASPSNTSTASPSSASTGSPSNASTASQYDTSTASQYDTSTATPYDTSTATPSNASSTASPSNASTASPNDFSADSPISPLNISNVSLHNILTDSASNHSDVIDITYDPFSHQSYGSTDCSLNTSNSRSKHYPLPIRTSHDTHRFAPYPSKNDKI